MSAPDNRPAWLAAVVLLAVAIAIVKPWSAGTAPVDRTRGGGPGSAVEPAGPGPASTAIPPASSAATPAVPATAAPVSSTPPGALDCRGPVGWRLATLERSPIGVTRSWTVLQPAIARVPADPAILPLRLPESDILALGFCGDGQAGATPQAALVRAWQRSGDGSWSVLRLPPATFDDSSGAIAAVYAPPLPRVDTGIAPPIGDAGDAGPVWPDGRYRFEVAFGTATAWFGLELGPAAAAAAVP